MKPYLEKVTFGLDSSWALFNRSLDYIPFEWHRHPEFELTLTVNSNGHRYIGDSMEKYGDGDLVLIGPNLPHSWHSQDSPDPSKPHQVTVAWFSEEWLRSVVQVFPELKKIQRLSLLSASGIAFSRSTANFVRPIIEEMKFQKPDARLLSLFSVLQKLSVDKEIRALSNVEKVEAQTDPRIARVLDYLHSNYNQKVQINDLAEIACLSTSAFHRVFRKQVRMTVMEYISRLRIGKACTLLIENELKVSVIASTVGYESQAQFNKEFRRHKDASPREFVSFYKR